jgi:hypothetical protein
MPVKNPFATDAIIGLLKGRGCDSLEPNSKLESRGYMSGFCSKFATLVLAAFVCVPGLVPAANAQKGGVRKPVKKQAKKDPPAAALPAYTPSPLEPLPLDQTPTVAPQVTYQGGELGIVAHNSTLADVLRAVRKLTGADMEIPPNATERVVADIGPGPARDVLAELLNGTHFNYVMVGSTSDPTAVQSIVLTPKSSASETASVAAPNRPGVPPRGFRRALTPAGAQQSSAAQVAAGQDMEDTEDDSADAADGADAPEDQAQSQNQDQQNPAQQQTPKTPEQLLQELQRQQQLQQQQQNPNQPGQPPTGLIPNLPPTQAPNSQKPD